MDYGADSWKLAPALEIHAGDVHVRKTATDSFHRTELHELLQSRGITSLVICGLQSEFCVDTTTRRAMALGYPVVLVCDGHSTVDNGILTAAQISAHHNKTLSGIVSFGPRTTAVPAISAIPASSPAAASTRRVSWTTVTRQPGSSRGPRQQ